MAHCSFFTFAQARLDGASFACRCVGVCGQVEQEDEPQESSGQRRRAFVPAGEPPHGGLPRVSPPYARWPCVFFSEQEPRGVASNVSQQQQPGGGALMSSARAESPGQTSRCCQ